MTDAQRRPGRSLGLTHYIFAAVLLVRLYALVRLTGSPFLLPSRGDMHFYDDWAQRILQGQLTDHLAFYGLPLYAYLLAFFYKIFGYSPFVPAFFQACLEAGTATLLYKIGNRVFERGAPEPAASSGVLTGTPQQGQIIGLAAAAGWALFLPAQAYSVILMPTAWLVFILWFVVWQIVKTRHAPSLVACLLLGLMIGVTAMGIATILFAVPLVLAAIVVRRPRTAALGSDVMPKVASVALLFAGIIAGTAPCWLHNYVVARDRVFLSAHSGINFWIGNNPVANGYPRIPPGLRAGQAAMLQDSIDVAEAAAGRSLKRSEVSNHWREKADAYVRENPGAWLRLVGTKLRNFWNAFQYDDLSIITSLREEGVLLPGFSFGLAAAFGLPGMAVALARIRRSRWIAAAILLHMASLLSVFVTERYRLAAVPGLLLFAAFALWKLWELCAKQRYIAAGGMMAASVASAWFVSMPQRDPGLWALEAYNSGWQALAAGNLPLAQRKLELAYAYVPENAETNLALGNLWMERQDRSRARSFYTATLNLDPTHKAALNNLAVLHLEAGDWAAAERLIRAALEREPQNAKTHYLLAKAAAGGGNLALASAAINKARELSPAEPEFAAFAQELERRRAAEPL
ncbi:MAG: tetratricopeptide repeat protein [Chthoniobacterales bacterium]|nr:tetratricopeptide repeat protein [Chthoniobacterales bacterium]